MKRFAAAVLLLGLTAPAFGAGGPLLPSSIYLAATVDATSTGNLSPSFYSFNTNTNGAGFFEGIQAASSLATNAVAVLQFNLPESIPTGTLKLRLLSLANASAGTIAISLSDGQAAVGANIATTTLGNDTQAVTTWTAADVLNETKIALTTVPVANDILTIKATYIGTSTLAAVSTWQYSIVWE